MIKHRFLTWLSENPVQNAVDSVTVTAGFSFPWWWPYFKATSDGFALLIPILTALFLIIRIFGYFGGHGKED